MAHLILASASPRRAALLEQIGIDFQVVESRYEEPVIGNDSLVESVALGKALHVSNRFPGNFVLAADTVVVCNGKVMGKPSSELEARRMLVSLSDRRHKVVTGVALLQGNRKMTAREETFVWMRYMEKEEIDAYVASGEPFDKAGSYAVQGKGAVFVKKVDGCFFNVVGLPLQRIVIMLREMGFPIW